MTEALIAEQVQTTPTLEKIRHEAAQSRGLDVMEEPVELTAEQTEALLETFKTPKEERAEAVEAFDKLGINRNVLVDDLKKRFDGSGIVELSRAEPGKPVSLLRPAGRLQGKNRVAVALAAVDAKTFALEEAAKVLGANAEQLSTYLEEATANVYASPHNGAPVISERVIDLPGGTIYEMNMHGAGDPSVIDAQVVAVRK